MSRLDAETKVITELNRDLVEAIDILSSIGKSSLDEKSLEEFDIIEGMVVQLIKNDASLMNRLIDNAEKILNKGE